MSSHPHLRIARPVTNLAYTESLYRTGLSLDRLGHFEDHEGFDGVMLGTQGGTWHFEFTYCRTHPVAPTPTPEDLIVLYLPDERAWRARCTAMERAGFRPVVSLNPWWDRAGRSFEDADGYRVVLQNSAWENVAEAP